MILVILVEICGLPSLWDLVLCRGDLVIHVNVWNMLPNFVDEGSILHLGDQVVFLGKLVIWVMILKG